MRVLILGGSGQLGSELCSIFPVAPSTFNTTEGKGVKLDVTQFYKLEDFVLKSSPEVVINAVGYTDVDGCETNKERALAVNALAVKHLVRACRVVGCHLVHVSTDYVFDGKKGLYKEDETPNPVNYYGLTKLLGESYALSYDEALVIRTSGVFKSKGFPLSVVRLLKNNQKVKALRGYYSPISARRLALAIYELVKLRKTGIIHVAGERISRLEFAKLIADRMELPKLIEEVDDLGLSAKRPFDSSLDCSRAKALLGDSLLSLKASLEDLVSFDHS